jgi:hypothetical protein
MKLKEIFVVEFVCVSKILHEYSFATSLEYLCNMEKYSTMWHIYIYICIIFIHQGFSNLVMDTNGMQMGMDVKI